MVASSVSPHYLRVRTPRELFIESPAPIQQAYCITATGHPNNLNDSMLLALLLPPFTRKKGLPYRQPIHLLPNNTHRKRTSATLPNAKISSIFIISHGIRVR